MAPSSAFAWADLVVGVLLSLAGALAFAFLPDGSLLRMAVIAPAILLAPGYLLIQAIVLPNGRPTPRPAHVFMAVGLSPAVVGLLALSTALVDGGFRPSPIVVVVTLACFLLAGLAAFRRGSEVVQPEEPPQAREQRADRRSPVGVGTGDRAAKAMASKMTLKGVVFPAAVPQRPNGAGMSSPSKARPAAGRPSTSPSRNASDQRAPSGRTMDDGMAMRTGRRRPEHPP